MDDMPKVIDYFLNADAAFLENLGVDRKKLLPDKEWTRILTEDFKLPNEQKQFYYITWLADEIPVGHSHINKIVFGIEAFMHLHLWNAETRQKGMGTELVKLTLPYYFKNFRLKRLYCEPYALNAAPNRTVAKAGFEFEKKYETTPGWINYFQLVNRWILTVEKYRQL